MNVEPEVIRHSAEYEKVPQNEIPQIEAYRHKGTRNVVYICDDNEGSKIVLDKYITIEDRGGIIRAGLRESGVKFRNIFEGLASVLVLAGSPQLRVIFSVLELDYKKISDVIGGLSDMAQHEKVRALVDVFGDHNAEAVRAAVKKALDDGILTPEEWAEIQKIARQARR